MVKQSSSCYTNQKCCVYVYSFLCTPNLDPLKHQDLGKSDVQTHHIQMSQFSNSLCPESCPTSKLAFRCLCLVSAYVGEVLEKSSSPVWHSEGGWRQALGSAGLSACECLSGTKPGSCLLTPLLASWGLSLYLTLPHPPSVEHQTGGEFSLSILLLFFFIRSGDGHFSMNVMLATAQLYFHYDHSQNFFFSYISLYKV